MDSMAPQAGLVFGCFADVVRIDSPKPTRAFIKTTSHNGPRCPLLARRALVALAKGQALASRLRTAA